MKHSCYPLDDIVRREVKPQIGQGNDFFLFPRSGGSGSSRLLEHCSKAHAVGLHVPSVLWITRKHQSPGYKL